VVATYGLTETCGGCVYDGLPLDGVEVRIGEGGQILLRGPVVFRRYRLDPNATEAAFDPEGWLRTRDAGEIVDGRLRVLGRLDDAILTAGEVGFPQEVEDALRSHSGVADAAVIGTADPEWGQRVVAFVVPTDPAEPPEAAALRAHVASRLARHKVPREIRSVGALPRSSLGKVRRGRLPP